MMTGPRYDADQAIAAGLKDAVDLDSVRDDPVGVIHQVLEPAHLSVGSASTTKTASAGWAVISQFSHRLAERHRTQADSLDIRRTLTCDIFHRTCSASARLP
jgi:hypothetical protein